MRLPVRYLKVGDFPVAWADAFVASIDEPDWYALDYRKAMVAASSSTAYDSMVFRHSSEYATNTIRDFPLREKYNAVLEPFIEWCRERYEVDEWVALAAKLIPQGRVAPHQDSGEFLERIHRLHFPLLTNPAAFYTVEGERVHMPVGSCYEIDNQRVHGVENDGTTDRIHLVVNIYGRRLIEESI
jgi:hypothetical protein